MEGEFAEAGNRKVKKKKRRKTEEERRASRSRARVLPHTLD
jgi:hypothetical protein